MNRVQLVGKLTADPAVTATQSGNDIVKILVSVTRWFGAEAKIEAISVTCIGKTKESARKLKKGQVVSVEARVSGREWEGKHFTEIVADQINSLSDGTDGEWA